MAVPSISNTLELHLDSTLGVTETAGAVSTWADQSGNGRDFTQSTASKRPIVSSDAIVNRDVIEFDGVDDFLTSSYGELTSDFTVFMVTRRFLRMSDEGSVNENGTEWASSSTSSGSMFAGFLTTISTNSRQGFETVGRRGLAHDISLNAPANRWQIKEFSMNAAGTTMSLALNGGTASTIARTVSAPGNYQLAGNGSVPAFPWAGVIGEVLVFDGILSGSDRTTINDYLTTRWVNNTIDLGSIATEITTTQSANLQGYWQLNTLDGGEIDSAGNISDDEQNSIWPQSGSDLLYNQIAFRGRGIECGGNEYLASSSTEHSLLNGDFTVMGLMQVSPVLERDRHSIWLEWDANNFIAIGTSNVGAGGIDQVAVALKVNGTFIYDTDHEPGSWTIGGWKHITLRRNGSTNDLIIDGTNIVSLNSGSATNANPLHVLIGSMDLGNAYTVDRRWKGGLQHMAIWDAALTDMEVSDIYTTILQANSGVGGFFGVIGNQIF